MIVIGLCPGLSAVSYSVLQYNGRPGAVPLDNDILHAGRGVVPQTPEQIAKRWRAHALILDVVLERNPPALLAIGPPADLNEAPDHILAARLAAAGIATLLGVPCIDFPTVPEVLGSLKIRQKHLTGLVRRGLSGVLGSRDRRVIMATASAMAAHRVYR